jgi:hypothetical protein
MPPYVSLPIRIHLCSLYCRLLVFMLLTNQIHLSIHSVLNLRKKLVHNQTSEGIHTTGIHMMKLLHSEIFSEIFIYLETSVLLI